MVSSDRPKLVDRSSAENERKFLAEARSGTLTVILSAFAIEKHGLNIGDAVAVVWRNRNSETPKYRFITEIVTKVNANVKFPPPKDKRDRKYVLILKIRS